MKGYVGNIEKESLDNSYFRKVLYTDPKVQLVVMSLEPHEEIGEEVHEDLDQFIRVESGKGAAILEGERFDISDGFAVVVPAGTRHNIINESLVPMKLYTVYSPPQHAEGTVHKTKAEAMASEEHYSPSASLSRQIAVYFVSLFLPPFGLWHAWKYLKEKDSRSKRIGIAALILTIISILITIWFTERFMNSISQTLNSDFLNY